MTSITRESVRRIIDNIDASGIRALIDKTEGKWKTWKLDVPNTLKETSTRELESVYEAIFERSGLSRSFEGCKEWGKCLAVTDTSFTKEIVENNIKQVVHEIKGMSKDKLEAFTDRVISLRDSRDFMEGIASINVGNPPITEDDVVVPTIGSTVSVSKNIPSRS